MQDTKTHAVVDEHGAVMFACPTCGRPLTEDDFFDLGLRLPERGESRDDYRDAELLDEVSHLRCAGAAGVGAD